MPKNIKYITVPLHISSVTYAFIALVCLLGLIFFPMDEFGEDKSVFQITAVMMVFFGCAFAVFIELVASALKKGKYWAWIASICLAGLYLPSAFLPLGIFMLIGLLKEDTKEHCKRKGKITSEVSAQDIQTSTT